MHLITDLDIGGTELMLLRLLPYLHLKFDLSVCCVIGRGDVGKSLTKLGIPIYYLDLRHRLDLGVIYRFYRIMHAYQPDILITHLIHPDIFGRIFGRLFGVRRVVCSQQGSLLQWEYLRHLDRLTTRLVDYYVVQTEVAKQELIRKLRAPAAKFITIPNSVLPFTTKIDQRHYHQKLGLPYGPKNIVCVSRLRRRKGHEYLLQAFEKVHKQYPATNLLLVGDGEKEAALRAQVENYASRKSIFFLGSRRDINEILALSDIFVLPSEAEGMSNAILEAMAAGLPCIVSDIVVNRAVINSSKNGLMFQVTDSNDLARKINSLLGDPVLGQRLGQQAQHNVTTQFDPRVIGEKWTNMLLKLI